MWFEMGMLVATLVVSYLTRPKVKYDSPSPGTFEASSTAQAGGEIPVLFGIREITGQNIIWWGDVKTVAIKKKGGKK